MRPRDNIAVLEEIFVAQSGKKNLPPSALSFFPSFICASIVGGLLLAGLALPTLVPVVVAPRAVQAYWEALPSKLPDLPLPQRSTMLDADGNKIGEFYSENRIIVNLKDVSTHVVDALISTEDVRFYEHHGVDLKGVLRATVHDITGSSIQGASTITQQLVKNTLAVQTNGKDAVASTKDSLSRKIEEVRYAVELENTYTKDQILEKYLNVVLYSNGVYGIGTASEYYYGKNASDLTIAESAMLIGLLKNPSGYDPIDHPEVALARRATVIDLMLQNKKITQKEADEANASPLGVKVNHSPNGCGVSTYPFYCQWVMDSILGDSAFGATLEERQAVLYQGGLTITTALDKRIQDLAQSEADNALGNSNRVAAGIAVVQPGTGKVVALVENRVWGNPKDVSPATSDIKTEIIYPNSVSFQPGSSFKVFTMAAALESGFPANAVITAPEVYNPSYMNVPPGGIRNNAKGESGSMTLYKGAAISSNTYFATLQERVGVLKVADMAENLGVSVPDTVGAKDSSFTLGVTDVSPLGMASAYATFAAEGIYCQPIGIIAITGPDKKEMTPPDPGCRQAVSKQTADTMNSILSQVIDGPDPMRTGKIASIGRPAAGKTGTTSSHAAAWFIGYTPQYATAVWLGDPRGGFKYPLSDGLTYYGKLTRDVYGSDIAAPLWKNVMSKIVAPLPAVSFPDMAGSMIAAQAIPDVRGMSENNAVQILTKQGLSSIVLDSNGIVSTDISQNIIVSQLPEPGTQFFDPNKIVITLRLSTTS